VLGYLAEVAPHFLLLVGVLTTGTTQLRDRLVVGPCDRRAEVRRSRVRYGWRGRRQRDVLHGWDLVAARKDGSKKHEAVAVEHHCNRS
jgi:hypothetical protein